MSDPTRYRVANNQAQLTLGGGILAVDPAGPLVEYADYAELRMERIHDLNQIGGLQEENARLTAELAKCEEHNEALCERMQDLNSEVFTASCTNARLHSQFANSELENARLKAEIERLKAEGDRLKEAGDEMAFHIGNDEWSQRKCADRWFDLREGKQS